MAMMTEKATSLPPDVFGAVVNALAEALVRDYRARWNAAQVEAATSITAPATASPWLTVKQASKRAHCGPKLLYREVNAGRLRAARVGAGRNLRLHVEWIDEWLQSSALTGEQPARRTIKR
jgi:excisionase family DNA binding protein